MKLYNANLSPNALRVRAVAGELELPVEIIDIDLRKGENKTTDFLKINPNGKVPVLVDGDFVLWESRAINAYLAAKKPERELYPSDLRKRAIVDQWSYWQAIHFGPAMQRIVFERLVKPRFGMGETDEKAVESGMKELAQWLPVLDADLAGKEWVAGALSLADFAVASTLIYAKPAGIPLTDTLNIPAWMARMDARPSWHAATAPIKAFLSN
jgi:glutathione S-transferase